MAELNISATTTPTKIADYRIANISLDSAQSQKETFWYNSNYSKWNGHYKKIAKIKKAIDGYATWILGKGYETLGSRDKVILEHIDGWGEDTLNSILWNMIVTKKVNGDAYAQIIVDNDILVNLVPLNPEFVRHVCNDKGRIIAYDYLRADKQGAEHRFKPIEILHLCNNRIGDEIHGVSDVEAVEWIVEAQEEAMRDHRKIAHRNGVIRVIEVDTDDNVKLQSLKTQWKTAVENGDILILPKGTAEAKDWHGTLQDPLPWIKYLDNLFYMSIGVPRVILGGSEEFTEASSKIGYLTFEQIYLKEQTDLEADIWNQLGIRIKFNKPASLTNEMLSSEGKNTGQTGFQPNDVQAGSGKA